jgi:hypothetical protein
MALAGKPVASISISMKLSKPDYNQNIPAYMKDHFYVSMWLPIFLSLIFLCITWIASGEAEYRFPLSQPGGILGGVLFINATTADNPAQDLKLFGSIKPGYGVGLRILADKKSRTNLSIDYGFGSRSSGFYLAASETL